MSMSLGEAAFNAYRANVGGKTYDDKLIPVWAELSERIRVAWEAAAKAAIIALVTPTPTAQQAMSDLGMKSFAEQFEEIQHD